MGTSFKNKCDILADFDVLFGELPDYKDFSTYHNLGISLAVAYDAGMCTLEDRGVDCVNDAWKSLCSVLNVDTRGEYVDLASVMAAAGERPFASV